MPTQQEKRVASVADSEIRVLEVLWDEEPLSAQEIVSRLEPRVDIKPQTIKTLINRLLTKGVIAYRERKRKYFYYPLVSKDEFYRLKTEKFLDRFYGGHLSPLISFFSHHGKLNDQDVAELKALVEKLEGDDDGK